MSVTMFGIEELLDPGALMWRPWRVSTGVSWPSCSNGSNSCDDVPRVRWRR